MLRDKNLIPLSHQHQRALALCVRIDRASPIAGADVDAWQQEIAQLFRTEISAHFTAEEQIVFPAAGRFSKLSALIEDLIADHVALRQYMESAGTGGLSAHELAAFGQRLSAHIRKEERQLFESLQKLLSAEELASLGQELATALKDAEQACALPNAATRLRPAK